MSTPIYRPFTGEQEPVPGTPVAPPMSSVGKYWSQHPRYVNDPRSKKLTSKQWDRVATIEANRGNYAELDDQERTDLVSGKAEGRLDVIRRVQNKQFGDYWIDGHMKFVESDQNTRAAVAFIIGDRLGRNPPEGYTWETARSEVWGRLTAAQKKRVAQHVDDFNGPLGESFRINPTAAASRVNAEANTKAIKTLFSKGFEGGGVEGGSATLKGLEGFVRDVNPELADVIAESRVSIEQQVIGEQLRGVGMSQEANPYAVYLGIGGDFGAPGYKPKRGSDSAERMVSFVRNHINGSGYDPEISLKVNGGHTKFRLSEAVKLRGAHKQRQVMEAIQGWATSKKVHDFMRNKVGEKRAMFAIELASNGRERLGRAAFAAVDYVRSEHPDLVDANLEDDSYRITKALETVGGGVKDVTLGLFSALGVTSKAMAAANQVHDDYGVRGFVFSDGTFESDPIQAFVKYQELLEKGYADKADPKLEQVMLKHRIDAGIANDIEQTRHAFSSYSSDSPDGNFAKPTQVLDKTEEGSWGEVWDDLSRSMDDNSPYLSDVLMRRTSVGREGTHGKVAAYMTDMGVDPINLVMGGSVVAAKTVARRGARLGELMASQGVKQRRSLLEHFKATSRHRKGRSTRRFSDGMLMGPETAAGAEALSATVGGGFGGEQFSDWLMTLSRDNPHLGEQGVKALILENPAPAVAYLLDAGDGAVRETVQRLMDDAVKAGRVNPAKPTEFFKALEVAQSSAVSSFLKRAMPEFEAIMRNIPATRPTRKWGFLKTKSYDTWAEMIDSGVYRGSHGIRIANAFAVSPGPAMRAISKAGGKINDALLQAKNLGAPLNTFERKVAKLLAPVMDRIHYIGGGMSANYWNVQAGGGGPMNPRGKARSVPIPLSVKRMYQMYHQRSVAHFTTTARAHVAGVIAENLPGSLDEITSLQTHTLSHLLDKKGTFEDRVAHLIKYRDADRGIKVLKGKTDEEILKLATDLEPARAEIRKLLDQTVNDELSSGLHRSIEETYVPHVSASARKTDEPVAHTLGGQHADDAAGHKVGTGETKSDVQTKRKSGAETIAEKIAYGEDMEEDVMELLLYRLAEHGRIMSGSHLVRAVSEIIGVPAVRGRHAALRLAEDMIAKGEGPRFSKPHDPLEQLGRMASTSNRAALYNQFEAGISEAIRESRGQAGAFIRLKAMLGMSTAQMMDSGWAQRVLDNRTFLRAGSSRASGRLLDKIIPDTLRPHVRNLTSAGRALLGREDMLRKRLNRMGVRWDAYGKTVKERSENLLRALDQEVAAEGALRSTREIQGFLRGIIKDEGAELSKITADVKKLTNSIRVAENAITRRVDGLAKRTVRSAGKKTDRDLIRERLIKEQDRIKELRQNVTIYRKARKDLAGTAADLKDSINKTRSDLKGMADEAASGPRRELSAARRVTGSKDRAAAAMARQQAKLAADTRDLLRLSNSADAMRARLGSSPLFGSIEGAIRTFARRAGRAEMRVKALMADAAHRFGVDEMSKAELLRRRRATSNTTSILGRMEGRPGKLPGQRVMDPALAHLSPQEAGVYEQLSVELAEYGIQGEVLASILFDYYGVTRLSQLSVKDALALATPDGPMASLRPFIDNPLPKSHAHKVKMGTSVNRMKKVAAKLGVNVDQSHGAVLEQAQAALENLKVLRAEGDKAATARLAKITLGQMDQIRKAELLHLPSPMAVPEAHELMLVKGRESMDDVHNTLVRAMSDPNSPIGELLMDVYVPLDQASALRTMLNEKIHIGQTDLGNLISLGTGAKVANAFSRMFRMTALTSALGPAFGWRNRIDGIKGQMHLGNFMWMSPANRSEVSAMLDGTIDFIDTPHGQIPTSRIHQAWEQFDTAMGARVDTERVIAHDKAFLQARESNMRAALDEYRALNKGRVAGKSEVHLKGRAADEVLVSKTLPKALQAKMGIQNIKGALGGLTAGSVLGWTVGGRIGGAFGGLIGYALGHTTQDLLRPGGMISAAGRAKPTFWERIAPVHSIGPEVMDKYDKVWYHYYLLKSGASETEALERTLINFRDWSNYKPADRKFNALIPVAFANFTKQNTIAQVSRMLERPGYGPMWVKFLKFLNDETPESMRPDWLSGLNSYAQDGRWSYMSDEMAAPVEFLNSLLGDGPEDVLLPVGKAAIRAMKGEWQNVRLKPSVARAIYDKYGPTEKDSFFPVYLDQGGNAVAEASLFGTWVGLVTGADVIASKAGGILDSIERGSYLDAFVQFMIGKKSYESKASYERAYGRGGSAEDVAAAVIDKARGISTSESGAMSKMILGEMLSEKDRAIVLELINSMDAADFGRLVMETRRVIKYVNKGTLSSKIGALAPTTK